MKWLPFVKGNKKTEQLQAETQDIKAQTIETHKETRSVLKELNKTLSNGVTLKIYHASRSYHAK